MFELIERSSLIDELIIKRKIRGKEIIQEDHYLIRFIRGGRNLIKKVI